MLPTQLKTAYKCCNCSITYSCCCGCCCYCCCRRCQSRFLQAKSQDVRTPKKQTTQIPISALPFECPMPPSYHHIDLPHTHIYSHTHTHIHTHFPAATEQTLKLATMPQPLSALWDKVKANIWPTSTLTIHISTTISLYDCVYVSFVSLCTCLYNKTNI